MSDLKDATINGLTLELESLADSFSKAIARYDYPNADGVDTDDMGQSARTVQVKCVFWDDGGGHVTFKNHYALLEILALRDLLEFSHPRYGMLKGRIESVNVRADERQRLAEVDFTFVEQMRLSLGTIARVDVVSATEAQFILAQVELQEEIQLVCVTLLGPGGRDLAAKPLLPQLTILEQFTSLSRAAQSFVEKINAFEQRLNATLTEIANPANSLLATINFVTTFPGRIAAALAGCCERYTLLSAGLRNAPASFLRSLQGGLLELEKSLPFPELLRGATAARVGVECGYLFAADETNRDLLRRQELTPAFDSQGKHNGGESPAAVMTVTEIETALGIARRLLQDAVDRSRAATSAKELARLLLEHANSIKLEREKLVTVLVNPPLPLHLLCLKYGLSYSYAPRIMAVNPGIINPNQVAGLVVIYGR